MPKCYCCGTQIAENAVYQIGDKVFCNEVCSSHFNKKEGEKGFGSDRKIQSKFLTKTTAVISLIFTLLIVSTVIWHFAAGSATEMRVFSSPDKSFSILLPGKVEQKREKMESEIGPVEIFVFKAKSENHDFSVIYVDYPHFMVEEQTPNKLLDGSCYGTIMETRGKLMKETVIDLQGNPGRELKIAGPEKEYIRARLYLVSNRLYQIKVVSKAPYTADKNVDTMFDSFKLTDKKVNSDRKKKHERNISIS